MLSFSCNFYLLQSIFNARINKEYSNIIHCNAYDNAYRQYKYECKMLKRNLSEAETSW